MLEAPDQEAKELDAFARPSSLVWRPLKPARGEFRLEHGHASLGELVPDAVKLGDQRHRSMARCATAPTDSSVLDGVEGNRVGGSVK